MMGKRVVLMAVMLCVCRLAGAEVVDLSRPFEVDDETIRIGHVGYAVQNFDEKDAAGYSLTHLLLESRPVEVERTYLITTEKQLPDAKKRLAFARTLYGQGHFSASAVQMKKGLKNRDGTAEEYALLGESLTQLRMYEPALEAVSRSLDLDENQPDILHEKAGLFGIAVQQYELPYRQGNGQGNARKPRPAADIDNTVARWWGYFR